ncbi:TIGR03943 family protein [Bacillus glycinifermentans]|uniref:TIGR03943 family putative permease subunit n=1 Tax=Bacillus glycinifermentans TaxID=1664069 RepID=UPI002DB9101D|nr:TIGR03943 family protein [Bacillus glycinifermentans]MEC3609126.1 TIGR03943 family protein [Bacillus glycinifermentans]
MVFQPRQFLHAVILAAFSGYIFKIHHTGEIRRLINPKYEYMSLIAAGVFTLLFLIQLTRVWTIHKEKCGLSSCGHDHGRSKPFLIKMIHFGVISLPLITGFTFAPAVLNSSVAANKGTMLTKTDASNSGHVTTPGIEKGLEESVISQTAYDRKMTRFKHSNPLVMKDDMFAEYYGDISENLDDYAGKEIIVQGFVHKERALKKQQIVLSRFLITHCIADASLIGFLAEWDGAHYTAPDTWLEIKGTIGKASFQGSTVPVIKVKKQTVIKEPAHPYVYPATIQMTE